MTRRVAFTRRATDDLERLYDFIAESAGTARALAYTRRVSARCRGLADFPERGTRRDDILPGLRTLGFERRVAVVFAVGPDRVTILRVLYGGRDLAGALADDGD